MLQYVIRRLLWSVVMVFLIVALVFAIFFILPGSAGRAGPGGTSPVARAIAGRNQDPDHVRDIERRLGLDQPVLTQFGRFVKNAVQGDLGYSYYTQEPVTSALLHRLPATVSLAIGASIIWLVVGVAIGVVSALRRRSLWDRASMTFALIGLSLPTFWLGIVAIFFFDGSLNWYDTGEYAPLFQNPIAWFRTLWLPWLVLAFVSMAVYSRMVRGNMLEVAGEDYIRTARAKGLPERKVIRHQLRSALTPGVTMYGLDLGILLGGAIITEFIFSIPGIGRFAVESVFNQNLPVILGTTIVAAVFVILANLIVDIVYAWIDPRVTYS